MWRRQQCGRCALVPRTAPQRSTARWEAVAAVGLVLLIAGCGRSDEKANSEKVEMTLNEALQAHVEGRLTEARQAYREVLELDELNKFAIYNLGLIDQTTGYSTEAELKYRKVLELDPNYGPALFNLAIIRAKVGDTTEAISLYRRAIAAEPQNAPAHLNLGLLLRANGEVEVGEAEIKRALELDPNLKLPPGQGQAPEPPSTTTQG